MRERLEPGQLVVALRQVPVEILGRHLPYRDRLGVVEILIGDAYAVPCEEVVHPVGVIAEVGPGGTEFDEFVRRMAGLLQKLAPRRIRRMPGSSG